MKITKYGTKVREGQIFIWSNPPLCAKIISEEKMAGIYIKPVAY